MQEILSNRIRKYLVEVQTIIIQVARKAENETEKPRPVSSEKSLQQSALLKMCCHEWRQTAE
jgi:hypothetical protein